MVPLGTPLPATTDLPFAQAVTGLLRRRGMTVSRLASLLRAEGLAVGRTRLHQLCTGEGAPPTPHQTERLSSVLGVHPGYFAEYRLWRARSLMDPSAVGFERAMANYARLRSRRDPDDVAEQVLPSSELS